MTGTERPLTGRTVLVTRPVGRGGALAGRLEALGARVEVRATIALEPPLDAGPARLAVSALARFDWIVFTSSNGVRFFDVLVREVLGTRPADGPSLAAIGPATARELATRGYRVDLVASESHAEGLAAALEPRVAEGERVLLVRPEVARAFLPDTLRGLGIRVEPVAFYRNVAAPDLGTLAARVREDRFDVVVLTSPSSLYRLLEAEPEPGGELRAALGRSRLVAIGPVTARAVERSGLEVAGVAAEPTDDAVAGVVRALFA